MDVLSHPDERCTVYGWARDTAQLVEHFLGLRGQMDFILSTPHNPGAVVHTAIPVFRSGRRRSPSHPLPHSKIEASLDYMKLYE